MTDRLRELERAPEFARLTKAIERVRKAPVYEQPHTPRSRGGTGFISLEMVTALRLLGEASDALTAALDAKQADRE